MNHNPETGRKNENRASGFTRNILTTMKTAVLVPSHIYYPDQLTRLDACLESLCSQTVVPDIFVSISFANDTYKRECSTLLRKYPMVKFTFSVQQKFQMEHLLTLSRLVGEHDMLMLCDDDDAYRSMRVEKFVKAFEGAKGECDTTALRFGGVREITNAKDLEQAPEYWAYGIPPPLLNEFFNRIKGYEHLLRHKFADMYLRSYLKRTGGKSMVFATLLPDASGLTMYQYTTDNPNSICARHVTQMRTAENPAVSIRDAITLGLISERIDFVKKQMGTASIPFSKIHEVVPDIEMIKSLTKTLYT